MKVTIIGAGSVGSTIAFTLATNGTASDIVLIDVNEEKAKGEAMDILQGAPFFGSMSIIAGDYSDAVGSDIVIITSGIPRKPITRSSVWMAWLISAPPPSVAHLPFQSAAA